MNSLIGFLTIFASIPFYFIFIYYLSKISTNNNNKFNYKQTCKKIIIKYALDTNNKS